MLTEVMRRKQSKRRLWNMQITSLQGPRYERGARRTRHKTKKRRGGGGILLVQSRGRLKDTTGTSTPAARIHFRHSDENVARSLSRPRKVTLGRAISGPRVSLGLLFARHRYACLRGEIQFGRALFPACLQGITPQLSKARRKAVPSCLISTVPE